MLLAPAWMGVGRTQAGRDFALPYGDHAEVELFVLEGEVPPERPARRAARARLGGTRLEPDRRVGVRPRQAGGPREDIPLHPPQSREVGEEVSEKAE